MLPSERAKKSLEKADEAYLKERAEREEKARIAKLAKSKLKGTPTLHREVLLHEAKFNWALDRMISWLALGVFLLGFQTAVETVGRIFMAGVLKTEGVGFETYACLLGWALLAVLVVYVSFKGRRVDDIRGLSKTLPEDENPKLAGIVAGFKKDRQILWLLGLVVCGVTLGLTWLHFYSDVLELRFGYVYILGVWAFFIWQDNEMDKGIEKANEALNEKGVGTDEEVS